MVNRENYLILKKYLAFKLEVQHRQPGTVKTLRHRLRFVLEWADETHFANVSKLRPTFPDYLNSVVGKNSDRLLCDNEITAILAETGQFLAWCKERIADMRSLKPEWLDTLTPVRRDHPIINERKSVSLETVRALLAVEWSDFRGRRTKAAAAFLFLSGIRVTAFATLPVKAVDLAKKSVRQDPVIGVKTKFRKRATTFLLDIPDLMAVVTAWDSEVRQHVGPDALWFYRVGRTKEEKSTGTEMSIVQKDIFELFTRAGLKPMSPHKFRHGHAEYAMKLAKDLADFKMLSQNLMHANLGVTDGIYAILSQDDMYERMSALGKTLQPDKPQAAMSDIAAIVEETVKRMMQAQADQAAQAQPAEKIPRKPRKARGAE